MYLAICICAILAIAIIAIAIKYEGLLLLFILPLILLFGLLLSIETNIPTYSQAKWSATIGNQYSPISPTIMFTDCTIINDGQELYVPAHYYLKIDWINHWEYCDTPLTIEYSDGRAHKYLNARKADDPYLKTGTVECH